MRLQSAAWSLKGTAQCGLDAACDRTTTPGTGNDKPCFKHTYTHTQLHCSTRTVHAYICRSFHDSTSLCKQQEDGYCCPCSTPTVQVYLLQFLQQHQHSQATRCLLIVSTHTIHAYLSQFPQHYQYSQTKRGWLSLSLHPCSCQLCPKISNPNFHTKTNP